MRFLLAAALVLVATPVQAAPQVALSGGPTFHLAIPPGLRNDAGSMWVNVRCGDTVQDQGAEFTGKRPATATAGPFTWEAGCTAYVWIYPDGGTPVSNVVGF